ncbi:MAG: hypothetical protein JSR44_13500 [Spirochaetes bacterium]|nr:hypothetical protein [Spirochaetota bacterium]
MFKQLSCLPLVAIFAAACGGSVKTVRAADYHKGEIKRVTVSSINGPSAELGNALADSLIPDLMEIGLVVVERKRLETVLSEHALQQTGLTDPKTTQAVGEILNVDTILVGDYSARKEHALDKNLFFNMGRGRGGFRVRGRRRRARAVFYTGRFGGVMSVAAKANLYEFDSLSLRMISVRSGEILVSASRKTPFAAEDLGDVLEELVAGIKSSINQN